MHVHGIDATYYTVHDLPGVTAFYTKLLGEPTVAMPGFVSEWTFADDTSFGIYQGSEKPPHPMGSVMFAVDDIAATIADLKSSGVKFLDDGNVTETPACHMAFGADPEGNQFILHKRK